MSAILLKGLKHPPSKAQTVQVLYTLLDASQQGDIITTASLGYRMRDFFSPGKMAGGGTGSVSDGGEWHTRDLLAGMFTVHGFPSSTLDAVAALVAAHEDVSAYNKTSSFLFLFQREMLPQVSV